MLFSTDLSRRLGANAGATEAYGTTFAASGPERPSPMQSDHTKLPGASTSRQPSSINSIARRSRTLAPSNSYNLVFARNLAKTRFVAAAAVSALLSDIAQSVAGSSDASFCSSLVIGSLSAAILCWSAPRCRDVQQPPLEKSQICFPSGEKRNLLLSSDLFEILGTSCLAALVLAPLATSLLYVGAILLAASLAQRRDVSGCLTKPKLQVQSIPSTCQLYAPAFHLGIKAQQVMGQRLSQIRSVLGRTLPSTSSLLGGRGVARQKLFV